MCYLRALLFFTLAACTSHKPYTPDEIQVHTGHQWYNDQDSDWRGPSVGISVGWALGARRAFYEDMSKVHEKTAEMAQSLEHLNQREEAFLESQEITDPVLDEASIDGTIDSVDDVTRAILDTRAGPLGLPAGMWVALTLLVIVAALAVGKKYKVSISGFLRTGPKVPKSGK